MRNTRRRLAKWGLLGLGVLVVAVSLYLSIFFFPYPLFPHHLEHAGFSVYSDDEIPADFEAILDDARRRTEKGARHRSAELLCIHVSPIAHAIGEMPQRRVCSGTSRQFGARHLFLSILGVFL